MRLSASLAGALGSYALHAEVLLQVSSLQLTHYQHGIIISGKSTTYTAAKIEKSGLDPFYGATAKCVCLANAVYMSFECSRNKQST